MRPLRSAARHGRALLTYLLTNPQAAEIGGFGSWYSFSVWSGSPSHDKYVGLPVENDGGFTALSPARTGA